MTDAPPSSSASPSTWKRDLPARMQSETFDLVLAGQYPAVVSLVRDEADRLQEIVITARGTSAKAEAGLPVIYEDLGIALSRAIQGRDPATGEFVAAEGFQDSPEALAEGGQP